MEHKFDINSVIERYHLDPKDVAEALFPKNQHKGMALDRVLKGITSIDTEQLSALAKLAGVVVSDLFEINGNWKGGVEDNCLILTKGPYKVKLNYNGVFMTLTRNGEILNQEIIGPKNISLDEFINHINQLTN